MRPKLYLILNIIAGTSFREERALKMTAKGPKVNFEGKTLHGA